MLMFCLMLMVVVKGEGGPKGGVLDAIVLMLGLVRSSDDVGGWGHCRREGEAVGRRVAGLEMQERFIVIRVVIGGGIIST